MAHDLDLEYFSMAANTRLRDQQLAQQAAQQASQQEYYDRKMALEELAYKKQQEEEERKAYEKRQADSLLKAAYDKIYGQDLVKQGVQGERALAERTKQVGVEMLKTNPSVGMQLIKEGNDLITKSSNAEQEVLQTDLARKEYAARILTGVKDEEGWGYAKASLAQAGFPIPQQFIQYNDNTKKWIASQLVGSKATIDEEKLALRTRELEARQQQFDADMKLKREKEQRIKENQAAARTLREIGYKTGKPASQKEAAAIIKVLNEDERFDDLSSGSKLEAAKELDYIARGIMMGNSGLTFEQARDQAKEMILNNIVDGEYRSNTSGKVSGAKEGLSDNDAKQKLGSRYKPGYRYWIEDGRIKGEKL